MSILQIENWVWFYTNKGVELSGGTSEKCTKVKNILHFEIEEVLFNLYNYCVSSFEESSLHENDGKSLSAYK